MKSSWFIGIAALAFTTAGMRWLSPATPRPMTTDPIPVRLLDASGKLTEPLSVPRVVKSEAAWRAQLTPGQYRITRTHSTEAPFCGIFHDNHKTGIYACVGCGLPLFRSKAKFDSGTGWPSFLQPIAKENIGQSRDTGFGMIRTEVHCARCESHLGHVFPDGPAPSRLRYCINSEALSFHERPSPKPGREKVIFGAGCFWGVEETFRQVKGVTGTRAGYAGGHTLKPRYEDVSSRTTGHAEVVEVEFDPSQTTFEGLLEVFWKKHDPFRAHRTGPDAGDPSRSAIFFTTPEQETIARASAAQLAKSHPGEQLGTEISLAAAFSPAEEYHQRYYEKHGATNCVVP